MSEWLQIIGSMGSLAAAIWIWRFAKIAVVFKYLAVVVGAIISLSIVGIVTIEPHPGRVIEIGEFLWRQAQRWVI